MPHPHIPSRASLVLCLALVALLGAFFLRPAAAVLAARLPVEPSSRLATFLHRLAGQDTQQRQPVQSEQTRQPQQRQVESRTTTEAQDETKPVPCPLPEYYDKLSGSAQAALLAQLGCVPPANPTATKPTGERAAATLEVALANVPVNDPTADTTNRNTQSESAVVLAGSNIVSSFNDSGSTLTAGGHFTGYAVSMDGGASFVDKGALPNGTGGDSGDPVLAYSAKTGTTFLATLEFNGLDALQIFRSTDNGMTFNAPINGAPGFTAAAATHDKEWIAVDNTPGSGYGNVYMAWRNFGSPSGITFTRSTDDGLTWGPSGGLLLANGGQGAFVTVGADHAVYVYWYAGTTIQVRKSTDQGVTFAPAVTVTPILSTGVNGNLGLGFRSNAFPTAVAHPTNPNIQYVTYNDDVAGADRCDVYFRQSNDGGATWSAPVRVHTDAGTNDQFIPSIAIKPDGSALAITWYDRRNDSANNLMERWGRVGTISGTTVTFGPDFVISDAPFAPVFGADPVVNATYMGDYDQMAADNTYFYTTFLDTRLGTQDVRFAKFTIAGPNMAVIKALPGTLSGGNDDQLVNADECNALTIPFTNNGTVTANNVTATLTTSTPGVYITYPTSTYPDVAPGQTVNNSLPFKISTTAAYVCGTNVNLTLTVNSSAGTDVLNLSLPGQSPTYTLATMTGQTIDPGTTLVSGSQADDATVVITLPFSYQFYNQNFTTLRASTNGNVQFTSNNTAFGNACLPSNLLNNALLPLWDDLLLTGTGEGIYTSVSGLAPNRIFNIEWRSHFFTGGGTANFEVRLYEGQAKFDMIYGTVNNNGAAATVGVQRDTGSSFTQFSCNTASLSAGLKITGTLAPCATGGGACMQPFTSRISDPIICTGDNNTLSVHAELGNTNNTPAGFSLTAPLPAQLIGIPGACLSSHGTCTLTATDITVTGGPSTLPANQTLTVDYKVRVANGTAPGTDLCITSTGRLDVDNNGTLDTFDVVKACTQLKCPDGLADVRVSDQKAGSVLAFPYYTSKAAEKKDTRITISNIGAATTTVHVFFIDGASCNQADQFLCLTPNASFALKTSEYDPEATGWLLAVAVDANGNPVQSNNLIGNAFVNDGEYVDNYGAESFQANSALVAAPNANGTATMFFDGGSYDAMPSQFAVELQSPLDAAGQRIVTTGMNGSLFTSQLTGAGQSGTGLIYNGNEKPFGSFSAFLSGSCQAIATVSSTLPRVPNGMGGIIPRGQVGTMKINIGGGVGLLMTPRTASWKGIRTLHKTALTVTTLTIPVLRPVC